MMISICNSNIREFELRSDWGLGNLGPRKKPSRLRRLFSWSQQGMILRPPDYESGATNQLSYGTNFCVFQAICCVRTAHQLAVTTVRLLPSSELAFLASDLKSTKINSRLFCQMLWKVRTAHQLAVTTVRLLPSSGLKTQIQRAIKSGAAV